jgi:predicted  nucleic acid-binding Zn-ribbon protein
MIYQLMLAGKEADVSTLKRCINTEAEERGRSDLEIDQTRQLNYRCEEHLIPLGLVAEVDPVDHDRPGEPPRRYALTEDGVEWFHEQDFAGRRVSVDLDNLRGRTESLADNIDELEDAVGHLEDDVRELQSEDGGALAVARSNEDDISENSDEIDDAYNDIYSTQREVSNLNDAVENTQRQLSELTDDYNDLDSRLSDAAESVSNLEKSVNNMNEWSGDIGNDLDRIDDAISANSDRLDQLADNVDAASDAASQPSETAVRADRRANRLKWIIILQSVMLVAMIAAGALVFEGRI